MKVMPRAIALFLVLTLLLGMSSVAMARSDDDRDEKRELRVELKKNKFEAKFKDWSQDWWNEALARLITKGVIGGSLENGVLNVAPQRHVTRLEASVMLVRVLGLEKEALLAPPEIDKIEIEDGKIEIEFEDGQGIPAWGRAAAWLGLKKGFFPYDGKHINWHKPLSRLDAAVMLVKAAGLGDKARAQAGAELAFADASAIPAAASGYVKVAVDQGLLSGYPNNTFQPNKKLTRAEWATLLDRLDRKDTKDPRQVKGTVTGVSQNVYGQLPGISMTTPVFPSGVTYSVDDTAVFFVNRQEATINDVKVGDEVLVQLSEDRRILMLTVVKKTPIVREVTGTVSAKTAGGNTERPTLTVTDGIYGSNPQTFSVADYAVIFGRTGMPVTYNQVSAGDRVELKIENNLIVRIKVLAPAPQPAPQPTPAPTQGTISSVTISAGTPTVITIQGADNTTSIYQLAANATVTYNNQSLTLGDLRVGDQVTLTLTGGVTTAVTINTRAP